MNFPSVFPTDASSTVKKKKIAVDKGRLVDSFSLSFHHHTSKSNKVGVGKYLSVI
jgi:hypothetical protein